MRHRADFPRVDKVIQKAFGSSAANNFRVKRRMLAENLIGPPEWIWDKDLLFIHVPKAAGSSILRTGVASRPGHRTYRYFEKWCPKGKTVPYTFAVVRHPYERFLSAYVYLSAGGNNSFDQNWARKHLMVAKDHNDFALRFLTRPEAKNWLHFRPQIDYLIGADGSIKVNKILRFESLNHEWERLSREFGLASTLPVFNKTTGKKPLLNNAAKAAIAAVYENDFRIFGYGYDTPTAVSRKVLLSTSSS